MRQLTSSGTHAGFVRVTALVALVALGLALVGPRLVAHKIITSKYTYDEEVFPILRDRCGQCHAPDGPTPMSLLTYNDANPWAEAIREQLLTEAMPPWYVDASGPAVKGGQHLTAKEYDVLMTWAGGGAPEGKQATPAPTPFQNRWRVGEPDLVLEMPEAHVVPSGVTEGEYQALLPTGLTEDRWVRYVDLRPGTPSMVRDAVISIENGPTLCAWLPGDESIPAPEGTAFLLPAGAKLRLTIRYKKNWQDEQLARRDRSAIGVYFADAPQSPQAIEEVRIDGPDEDVKGPEPRTWAYTLEHAAKVLAVRPGVDRVYGDLQVDAALQPSGRRIGLLRLHAIRPGWYRRYWLVDPIELPAGTLVEVTALSAVQADTATPQPNQEPVSVTLDMVRF